LGAKRMQNFLPRSLLLARGATRCTIAFSAVHVQFAAPTVHKSDVL
jgi:hypothetical protein